MADESWAYYHALYHLVTHWAAFVATLALLVTIGVVISASPTLGNRWYFIFAIATTTIAAWFFLWRMGTFGAVVNTSLKGAASTTYWLIPHPWNLLVGAGVSLVVAALDFIALYQTAGSKVG